MKKFLIKGLILIIILALPLQGVSMSYFSDTETASGNTFGAGCWGGPFTPTLAYPDDGYVAGQGSVWLSNPHMDWDDSWACPGKTVTYQYESYHDEGPTNLAYVSGILPTSMIPAPGTPDGTYYWRVRAHDGDSWSGWSNVWLLIVDRSIPSTTPGSANNSIGDPATSPPEIPTIVINEILPNPSGDDDAAKPAGEWVELYNRSGADINIDGWVLYDADDTHELIVSQSNSDNNNNLSDSGETIVPGNGFLVVYRDGDGDFSLNNDGDTVKLYDDTIGSGGILIDSYTYTATVPDDKSIARYPDGSDIWYDPIPTPGGPNLLETESNLEKSGEEVDLEEPNVSEPSAELNDKGVFEEEAEEPINEEVPGPQDPTDPSEVEEEGDGVSDEGEEDGQTQPDENEQETVIEETEDEVQGTFGDESASEPQPENNEPQPEDLGQSSGNDEVPTE